MLDALVRETSVGETYFFREMEGLARIVDVAQRIAREMPRPLTVWSAGCASGEEAYSLAILFLEALGPAAAVRVLATDVNASALVKAREASYGSWSFRNVEPTRKMRWFEPEDRRDEPGRGDRLRPIEAVRSRVHFQPLNLAQDDVPGNPWPKECDLIVCRNVLVYFAPAAARLVARRFAASLAPAGELVLASTDPPLASTALRLARHVPPVYVRAEKEAPARAARTSKPPRSARVSPVPRAPTPPTARSASRRPPAAVLSPVLPPAPPPGAAGQDDLAAARALADEGKVYRGERAARPAGERAAARGGAAGCCAPSSHLVAAALGRGAGRRRRRAPARSLGAAGARGGGHGLGAARRSRAGGSARRAMRWARSGRRRTRWSTRSWRGPAARSCARDEVLVSDKAGGVSDATGRRLAGAAHRGPGATARA